MMARAIGIRGSKIQDIERNKQKIPSDLLTQFSEYFGVDVEFILTGTRSQNLNRVAEEAGTYNKQPQGVGALSKDEEVLLKKYRQLDPKKRTHAQAVVDALASAPMKKDKTG